MNQSLSKDNIINTLGLELDKDGIIRCHGRFTNAIKHVRRNKGTNIFAKERALDNVTDQGISQAVISRRNLTHIIPDEIYLLDTTRTSYSQSCNISMWCMQKVQ